MSAATTTDWRTAGPRPGDYEMVADEGDSEPTIFVATDNRNADKYKMARRLECDYVQVRMTTFYAVWEPEDAEEQWRYDHCECEDGPCDDLSSCETTKPAESIHDFWDESGWYCPWIQVKRSRPGAVAFRRGSVG